MHWLAFLVSQCEKDSMYCIECGHKGGWHPRIVLAVFLVTAATIGFFVGLVVSAL